MYSVDPVLTSGFLMLLLGSDDVLWFLNPESVLPPRPFIMGAASDIFRGIVLLRTGNAPLELLLRTATNIIT